MAHDLILGKTRHDWSCGSWLSLPTEASRRQLALDVSAQTDSKKLGQLVRDEIQKNYSTIVRLDAAKRLPVVERKAFGVFMRKWVDFGAAHAQASAQPVFTSDDVVALRNFREANQRFTERLAVFDQMARTPLKKPLRLAPAADSEIIQFHPPGWQSPSSGRPWGWLLGLGLGLAGLGFLAGKNRKQP
jgi:hypothetical protein